jgi:hypothetical protein
MSRKELITRLFWPLVAFLLISCGKKHSDEVDVSIGPEKPIVINADITVVDPSDSTSTITIKAPWFKHKVTVLNNSGNNVTVVAMNYEILGNKNGVQTTNNINVSSSITTIPYLLNVPGTGSEAARTKTLSNLYIFGLTAGDNFNYSVRAKAIGWFGPPDAPNDRLEKLVSFQTQ